MSEPLPLAHFLLSGEDADLAFAWRDAMNEHCAVLQKHAEETHGAVQASLSMLDDGAASLRAVLTPHRAPVPLGLREIRTRSTSTGERLRELVPRRSTKEGKAIRLVWDALDAACPKMPLSTILGGARWVSYAMVSDPAGAFLCRPTLEFHGHLAVLVTPLHPKSQTPVFLPPRGESIPVWAYEYLKLHRRTPPSFEGPPAEPGAPQEV